jgi:hypothetical protein
MFVCATAMCALAASGVSAQTVPTEYQDLHGELYGNLNRFRDVMAQQWDGSRAPVAFSAELLAAHSARGDALLQTGMTDAIRLEIDNLKALGVRAVTVHVGFPMLHRRFHRSEDESQRFLAFYTEVANLVRAGGLKLIVSSPALFSDGTFGAWDVGPYYASLTLAEYQQGRMEVARTIASALRPDYLTVITEPDTEADQVGKPELGTLAGSRALLDVILAGLQANPVPGVAIGAGVGTWQKDYRSYVESFAATAIDFVDMHIYPTDGDYLVRALEIADIATGNGKQIAMSETWLFKTNALEHELPHAAVFRRDVFSFWAPLDSLHVQTMVDLAHFKRLAFMSPFWAGYLRGYVDYNDTTKSQSWLQLNRLAQIEFSNKVRNGTYALSGYGYHDALVVPADVTPPAEPPGVLARLKSAVDVAVTWETAADDIGAAGYVVHRDGSPVGQTSLTHFIDTGLAEARTYQYSVAAFDAAGHVSAPVSTTITTPDMTAPSAPANVTAVTSVAANRVDVALSWTPSSDNVGVTQYVVLRGTSPSALTRIAAVTTNAYTLSNVKPDTTHYYGVEAVDATLNVSAVSTTSVTTPVLPDVTPPFVSVVYPADNADVYSTLYLYGLTYDLMGGSYDVPSGSVAMRFFIDGEAVGNELTVPYNKTPTYSVFELQMPTPRLSRGEHLVTAVARDAAGNVATSPPIRIRVR